MSTRTRTSRPQAEEPEQPDTEPSPEEEEEEGAGQEPEAEPEGFSIEAQARKIDNAKRKYHRDLAGIVGDLDGTLECPLCNGMGLIEEASALKMRPGLERCSTCKGLGKQLTGSLVPNFAELPCLDCNGNGYVTKQPENVYQHPSAPPVQQPLPAQPIAGTWDPASGTFTPYAAQVNQ
jgi:hypothetical protein